MLGSCHTKALILPQATPVKVQSLHKPFCANRFCCLRNSLDDVVFRLGGKLAPVRTGADTINNESAFTGVCPLQGSSARRTLRRSQVDLR